MKILARNADLSNAILKVVKAINGKNLGSALEGIKFTCKGDLVTLSATDMELSIEKTIACETFMEGEALIPGKMLSELVKNIDENEDVEIYVNDNRAKISYGSAITEIQCLPVEEFPIIKKDYNENSFDIVQKDFKELITKTSFACATDIGRPIYCGCYFEIEGDTLNCVALDGYRMALGKKQVKNVKGQVKAVIPQRTLQEIVKLATEADEKEITVNIQDNFMMLEVGGTLIISRLLEGEFIDYKKLIVTNYLTSFTVNSKALKNCLDRASIVAKEARNVIFTSVKNSVFSISAQSEIGQVNESLIINLEGEEVDIGFNFKNITDILSVSDCEFISFGINDSIKPCYIKPMQAEEFLYMVLPIRR